MPNMEILDWIGNWFAEQCDGDWEHENYLKLKRLVILAGILLLI
jgi:hypothetical protein